VCPDPVDKSGGNESLDQSDLDDLMAQFAAGGATDSGTDTGPSPASPPPPDDSLVTALDDVDDSEEKVEDGEDITLDQEALDALLGADDGGGDEPASQSAVDDLLTRGLSEAEPAASTPDSNSAANGTVDQSAIDQLLNSADTTDERPVEQAEVEAILAQRAAAPSQASAISQDEIDRLMASDDSPEEIEPDVAESDEMLLDQSELDAVIGRVAEEGEAADQASVDALMAAGLSESDADSTLTGSTDESGDDELIDQSALDALVDGEPADEASSLDQSDIDALLSSRVSEEALDSKEMDEVLTEKSDAVGTEEDIDSQSAIDALVAENAGSAPSPKSEPSGDVGGISQDDIDALIGSGSKPSAPKEQVGAENVAAAAPSGGPDLLTQDALDGLMAQAKEKKRKEREEKRRKEDEEGRAIAAAAARKAAGLEPDLKPEPETESEQTTPGTGPSGRRWKLSLPKLRAGKKEKKPRKPSKVLAFINRHPAKTFGSMAAGILVTLGTFTLLYTHQTREPDLSSLSLAKEMGLRAAVTTAKDLMHAERFEEAAQTLAPAVAQAPASSERADAEFLLLEARMDALPETVTDAQAGPLHEEIDKLVAQAPNHPRAVEALLWKAELYKKQQVLHAASEVYDRILDGEVSATNLDDVLYAAAKLALSMRRYEPAAEYAQRLLTEYPGSRRAIQTKLLLGDIYLAAGQSDDAIRLYRAVAQAQPDTALGARAFAQLGEIYYDTGRYREAVAQLQTRLELATTIEGNDRIYLLLAKAERALGDYEKAEQVLRELVDFFPETSLTPEAFS